MTTIAIENPRQPDVDAMLRDGAAYALSLYPPDGCFLLDVDELSAPNISVFIARDDAGRALGMAALVDHGDSTGELKRMFVREEARGQGVAAALLQAVEAAAREQSIHTLLLETGTLHVAAQALYAKHGFTGIAPFGPYVGNEYSVCMQKALN